MTSDVMAPAANTPYTTEGMLARSSTIVVMACASHFGAIFTINNAVSTLIGKEISSAPKEVSSVLITMNPAP